MESATGSVDQLSLSPTCQGVNLTDHTAPLSVREAFRPPAEDRRRVAGGLLHGYALDSLSKIFHVLPNSPAESRRIIASPSFGTTAPAGERRHG